MLKDSVHADVVAMGPGRLHVCWLLRMMMRMGSKLHVGFMPLGAWYNTNGGSLFNL
jgi:hypothetical protein